MQAVTQTHFGDPDVLEIGEVACPTPGPTQLLVKVHATALNRADLLQREGKYPPPPGETSILGLELAGEIVALGKTVTQFHIGQRVFGLVAGGSYAEYCLLESVLALEIPKDWSYEYAAAIPEAFLTAHGTLIELGAPTDASQLLIHAGGSGVGTTCIQMARILGATVYITASNPEKLAKAEKLGALGINYKTQDFEAEIRTYTQNQGLDIIIDFIGAPYFAKNLALLKLGGRLIQVSRMGGALVDLDLNLLLKKRLQIKGFILRSRPLDEKADLMSRFEKQWMPPLRAHQITPIIDCIFPIQQVREAHRYMEASKNFGKVVLVL